MVAEKSKRDSYVVTSKVVDVALGKHRVVLKFGLAERGCVACSCRSVSVISHGWTSDRKRTGNDDELGLSGTESLEGRLVSEHVLAGLHNKREARVNGVGSGLLGLLGGFNSIPSAFRDGFHG